jgi:hypothetical protein
MCASRSPPPLSPSLSLSLPLSSSGEQSLRTRGCSGAIVLASAVSAATSKPLRNAAARDQSASGAGRVSVRRPVRPHARRGWAATRADARAAGRYFPGCCESREQSEQSAATWDGSLRRARR